VLETTVLAPTSNVCLRIGDPDGVQEEHKRFILAWAKECPMSSAGEESCIILYRSAYSRGYKLVREGGAPRSHVENGVSVCVSVVFFRLPHFYVVSFFLPSPPWNGPCLPLL
jgi:hypothetical protein